MKIESVSAVLFFSQDPAKLAAFYSTNLGIPFELDRHGKIRDHFEADVGDVHLAVLKSQGAEATGEGRVLPTFRVRELDAFIEELGKVGTKPMRAVLQLDDGMRVASFRDPDGNAFSLIEIAA